MDFTREPIIETVITPKEGCKIVVRSSKSTGQEEYFVDAVEVVSFGSALFFRSTERPKTFLVPASDYEILEVREARMVLKNVGLDRTIKIAGGREAQMRSSPQREPQVEKSHDMEETAAMAENTSDSSSQPSEKSAEPRTDKKRDRRRQNRRRRGRDGSPEEEGSEGTEKTNVRSSENGSGEKSPLAQQVATTSILTSLLPPPPTLISETIARYKDNALFKDAFYSKEEQQSSQEAPTIPPIPLEQPQYGSFEVSEDEEEQIYQQRKRQKSFDSDTEENLSSHPFEEFNASDIDTPSPANHEPDDL